MIFETERLILRPWKIDDADSLYEYAKDPLVGPMAGWPVHTSVDNSREIIKSVLSKSESYAVCLKGDNKAIGSIGLSIGEDSNICITEDEAEIGYWIGVPFWGQGLIPEAVGELMKYAFEHLKMKQLWCGYFHGNEKSKIVQEKCGFKYQYTIKEKKVELMNDVRTEHVTSINRIQWSMKNHNTPTLETERLILRKFNENDIEALFAIHEDEEVNRYLPWFPLKSLEETEMFFKERYVESYSEPKGYKYAICLKTDNIPIGYVNMSVDDSHDLGYGLMKEFWHKGIVTEASKAVLEQVKKDGFLYVTATHDVKNPRSGGVMKQLGMSYKYSYEEQWKPKGILVTFRMYQLNFDGENHRVYKEYWDKYPVSFVEKDGEI